MQITELDKLQRDLDDLIQMRRKLDEIRKGLSIAKRITALWIYCRVTRMIMDVDWRIGQKKAEIAREEARDGHGQKRREEEAAGSHPVDADLHGRAETDVQHKRKRADAAGRDAGQLGDVEPVRAVAAGEGPGGGSRDVSSAEECLRSRYRNRNRDALRDWQREVMEAEREGRKEMLVL